MTCAPARSLLEAYIDDELDAAQKAQVAGHLAACPSCAETHARLWELRGAVRSQAPYYRAPAGLGDRIRAGLRHSARPVPQPWRWLAIAAGVLLVFSAAWNIALLRSRSDSTDLIARNVLSSHVRSLMGTHLLDVPSADQHTVKPWFNGKLDFSPDVRDFAAQGFPLIGGRIDYVGDRPVAALVYQHGKHIINLFTWPSPADGPMNFSTNGYHILHWNSGGMAWWAVSDLNVSELTKFESMYK
ncbi:MAG TPA: anti-sigma factor [Bryobacteraceae bacterium]|jgi:anti-sigma factor RsiW|nr:anti-sigma factor [Bryobacteraceae bacterium]